MLTNTLELVVNDDPKWQYQVVDFFGNLDSYNLKEKKEKLFEIVNNANKDYLVFNFQNLIFINSECISLLMQFNEVLQKKAKRLVIMNAKKNVVDVLNVIGIFQTMPYFKDILDFTNSIK
jgi:anti-anti-sigma factor